MIHPQRLDPGVADVSRVRRTRHAAYASRHATAVARRQELPLLQRKVRQLINADEKKFRALILVNVVLVTAVAEASG